MPFEIKYFHLWKITWHVFLLNFYYKLPTTFEFVGVCFYCDKPHHLLFSIVENNKKSHNSWFPSFEYTAMHSGRYIQHINKIMTNNENTGCTESILPTTSVNVLPQANSFSQNSRDNVKFINVDSGKTWPN